MDATRVFWVEHGGFDALGNPLEDGALRAQLHSGGPVETIADGLAGPVALGVTTSHAYVQLAQQPRADGSRGPATVRVRLIDGHVEPVTEGPLRCRASCFTAIGDRAVWGDGGTIWTQGASDPQPLAIRTGERAIDMLAADETHAYFTIETRTRPPELYRVPLTGGAAVSLGPSRRRATIRSWRASVVIC